MISLAGLTSKSSGRGQKCLMGSSGSCPLLILAFGRMAKHLIQIANAQS